MHNKEEITIVAVVVVFCPFLYLRLRESFLSDRTYAILHHPMYVVSYIYRTVHVFDSQTQFHFIVILYNFECCFRFVRI